MNPYRFPSYYGNCSDFFNIDAETHKRGLTGLTIQNILCGIERGLDHSKRLHLQHSSKICHILRRSFNLLVVLLTSLADGKQVTVGLYRLSEGTITWSGYEAITWKGNFAFRGSLKR